jgi:GGDEF domain-containing protein
MEYVAADPSHGPLLDDLAARTEDRWSWIWPVRESRRAGTTIGLIAVGRLADAAVLTPELRHAIGPLLSLCWQYVAARERLNLVQRTDRASGVLTRNDFFVLAHEALCDSYRANEPVVLAVLVLEGLRRLDDTRCWRERDELIERLGQLIAHRARSDDVVGRFTDDRFVILLRRLDSGLGRLIAEKMLSAANACLGRPMGSAGILPAQGAGKTPALSVRLRLGLAGSGFAQPPLQKLLSAAFDAVERARKENVPLATDLGAKRCQEPFAAERPRGCSAPEVPDTFLPTEDPQP